MPLHRLRNSLFSEQKHANSHQHSRDVHSAVVTMAHVSTRNAGSWSSTSKNFTRLRFFVWTGGDPGFTLTTPEDGIGTFACNEDAELKVDRVTAVEVWEAGVRPGDVLETVAGKCVHTMDPEATIVLVQMSKSPSILRFRSPTSGERVRFDVLLGRKKLGVSLTGDGGNFLVTTRVSGQCRSEGASTPTSFLGDILVAVNGMDAVAAGVGPTLKFLDTCPRPLRLTFERIANDDNGESWLGSQPASEESGEHRRRLLALTSAIPNLAISGTTTRATASRRFRKFLRSLMPTSAPLRPQIEESRADSQFAEPQNFDSTPGDVLIEWESEPLGLSLLEDVISGAPVVNRLTGKGSSANMECLQHGFELHSINGARTEGRSLDDVCQDLLKLPKPVRLIFRPPLVDDTSEEGNNSEHNSRSSDLALSPSMTFTSGVELDAENHRALVMQAAAVQSGNSQQSSLVRKQHEYEVVWTAKRLGLQLKIPDNGESRSETKKSAERLSQRRYPIVHKILKESTLGLPSDAVGHLLVSVNNWNTCGLSTTELRTLLRVAALPAVLRFRKHEGSPGFQRTFLSGSSYGGEDEILGSRTATFGSSYSLLWSEGELGITFGCYQDADHRNALVVYVKRISPGQAKNSNLVAVGDLLSSINGKELPPKQKFKKTMRALTNTKQTFTLGFRRLMVERCSESWDACA